MKKRAHSVSFVEKHSPFLALAIAFSLVGLSLTIDRFDLLPLQGAATPMYGALPTPMYGTLPTPVLRRVLSSSSKKSSQTSSRRAKRSIASSSRSSVSARTGRIH